jgi:glucuronate isomerase
MKLTMFIDIITPHKNFISYKKKNCFRRIQSNKNSCVHVYDVLQIKIKRLN